MSSKTEDSNSIDLGIGVRLPIKYVALVVLVLQNSAFMLFLRASRLATDEEEDGRVYISSTAVVCSEMSKLVASLLLIAHGEGGSIPKTLRVLHQDIVMKPVTTTKLLVPAALYTFQNNLMFLAATYLDAATFQITYQLKILTTAVFSVILLGKQLAPLQWVSLLLLTGGVALIRMPTGDDDDDDDGEVSWSEASVGLAMVLTACCSSGFAGVYFEKMLKGETAGVWVLNVQLAFFSSLFAIGGVFLNDRDEVLERGFFAGYTDVTVATIGLQAFGGLVVAMVVKYAGNILKGFATSISIIVSTVVSVMLFGLLITTNFAMGALLVVSATAMYSRFQVTKK